MSVEIVPNSTGTEMAGVLQQIAGVRSLRSFQPLNRASSSDSREEEIMPFVWSLNDIVEHIADLHSVYGTGPEFGDHEDDCPCRICFTSLWAKRIEQADCLGSEDRRKLQMLEELFVDLEIPFNPMARLQVWAKIRRKLGAIDKLVYALTDARTAVVRSDMLRTIDDALDAAKEVKDG